MNNTDDIIIAVDELGGRYTLKEEIGTGAQGAVYITEYNKVLVKLLNG